MEEFCGTPFWDPSLLNQTLPDTSPCFQETLLSWLPAAYLWILAPFYSYYLKKHNAGYIKVSHLHRVKSFICLLLIIPPILDVFKGIADLVQTNGELPLVYVVTPAIVTLTMVLAFALVQVERLRGVRSSALLFIFWSLTIVCSLFELWSKCINFSEQGGDNVFRYITFFLFFSLLLLAVVLSSLVDDKPFYSPVEDDQNICPEECASFISKVTYWWFTGLIALGYKRPLTTSDLWSLQVRDKASHVVQDFRRNWKAEKRKAFAAYHTKKTKAPQAGDQHPNVLMVSLERDPNGEVKRKHDIYKGGDDDDPETSSIGEVILEKATHTERKVSLVKALRKTYGRAYLVGSFLKLIITIMVFIQPLVLRLLIQFIETPAIPSWRGYFYAIILLLVAVASALINNWADYIIFLIAMHIRTAVLGTVYRKAIHLTSGARKSSTIGEVVNLMSVDAQKLMDLCRNMNTVWTSPLQIIITIYLLVQLLGAAVFAGIIFLVLLVPVNMWVAGKVRTLQIRQMSYKDQRVKLMGEVLNGIKVLKLYAWERSFEEKVMHLRRQELKVLRKAAYFNVISAFGWTCAPFMVTLISFAVFLLANSNNVLDAETIFVSLSLFNLLRFPLGLLPMVIINIIQANVSIKRLSAFLKLDELDPQNVDHFNMPGQAITVEGGKFSWAKEEEPILTDINLDIPQGSLVAVVGQVGAGKSSLLSALLGEMEKIDGRVFVEGSVGYIAQQAWIQNDTVRGNILFGKDLNSSKYEKILQGCALARDLEVLPGGDQTEIGEKGINLSGGQKQRVSIARAVYANSDIYLLDDPLSAVDAHVGKHIFENVIGPNGLLRKKTRVLVTHGISFLPQVDQIVVLKGGQVSEVGSYNELLEKNGAFAEFLQNYSLQEEEKQSPDENEVESMSMISGGKSRAESFIGSTLALAAKEDADVNLETEGQGLIEEEKAETGKVASGVYITYLKAIGLVLCLLMLSSYLLFDAFSVGGAIWLTMWSGEPTVNGTHPTPVRNRYLVGYGLFGLGQALAAIFSEIFFAQGIVRSATRTHTGLLCAVFRAPMQFFDVTPLGRILNRFSRDILGVDSLIPMNFSVVIKVFLALLEVFIAIIYGLPILAAVIVPVGVLYVFMQRYFVCTTRQLKRLESISRSPIYSHFSESLSGTSTIRAFGKQKEFILHNEQLIDRNQETHYPNIVSQRWLGVRLGFIGNGIVFFTALFSTINRGRISSGIVGLVVVYAMQVTETLQWMVRMTSELETNIVAVERIKEYTEIDQEAPMDIPEKKPEDTWPSEGRVEIKDYSTRYREGLDLVLKGISLTIAPGEKIGIVGRTGAGKSSLTLGLFRIIESAGGSISIDGVEISTIGLYDLRSKITIIPQDPVLFAGDLRMNLDPFERYTDDEIWEALRHSHLDQFVSGLEEGLMHQCSEGGTNLSVGQRQLICLARALLRKTKILVLDEATSAVDLETDDLIQATIRTEFEDCTVITIAHRLNTIMDNTRVLVLEAGEVSEYDSPTNLLEKGGAFYGMAKEAGLVAT